MKCRPVYYWLCVDWWWCLMLCSSTTPFLLRTPFVLSFTPPPLSYYDITTTSSQNRGVRPRPIATTSATTTRSRRRMGAVIFPLPTPSLLPLTLHASQATRQQQCLLTTSSSSRTRARTRTRTACGSRLTTPSCIPSITTSTSSSSFSFPCLSSSPVVLSMSAGIDDEKDNDGGTEKISRSSRSSSRYDSWTKTTPTRRSFLSCAAAAIVASTAACTTNVAAAAAGGGSSEGVNNNMGLFGNNNSNSNNNNNNNNNGGIPSNHEAPGVGVGGGSSTSGGPSSYIKVSRKAGGLAQKIRGGVCLTMDELQRDLMQERWDLLVAYPNQLRSYVPVLTTYTDSAFSTEIPSDYGLRVALRYEVGRFFASVERLKRAIDKHALSEAYTAYADMSLHLDRYLRVGGLYTYYDGTIDNEPLFKDYNDALVYADPVKDPAEVRDLIVLCKGPDKGRTGIVIGMYPSDGSYSPSGSGSKRKIGAGGGGGGKASKSAAEAAAGVSTCVVKLERYRGMREIRVVPRNWAAKRLGEQDPDDVFLIPRSLQQQNHLKKTPAITTGSSSHGSISS